ncbi:MAG: hypothetical protein U1E39_06470 [Planctomycetota bacterium]
MIERFNFFDLYGYLIPGTVVFAIVAAPVSIATGVGLDSLLPSGLDLIPLLIFAYVGGLALQRVAEWALPSTVHRGLSDPRGARPSDVMLDSSNNELSLPSKVQLLELAKARGWLVACDSWDSVASAHRQEIFFHLRSVLVEADAADYAEQYQGMYTMCRGISMALLLAAPVYLAWAIGAVPLSTTLSPANLSLLLIVLAALAGAVWLSDRVLEIRGLRDAQGCVKRFPPVRPFWVGALLSGSALGVVLQFEIPLTSRCSLGLLGAGLAAVCGGLLLRHAHIHFAKAFARAIYLDSLALGAKGGDDRAGVTRGGGATDGGGAK